MDSMQADFDYRIKSMQNMHQCELERLQNDLGMQIESLKLGADNKRRELCQIIDSKDEIIRDLDNRFKRFEGETESAKAGLVSRVRTLEANLN